MTGRIAARFVRSRRRVGTVAVCAVALLLGYHVIVGDNGWNVYQQKLAEDRQLAQELRLQKQKNDHLKQHVDHLQNDPNAIAYEVHQRLLYTGPREVIVLDDAKTAQAAKAPAK